MAKKIDDTAASAVEETGGVTVQAPETEAVKGVGAEAVKGAEAVTEALAESPTGLQDVDELIRTHDLPAWQGAALCRFAGWAPGKAVSEAEFEKALEGLAKRPMGGGR
ncbi:hypothetical protein [Humidesulfovibrio sp.]